MRQWAFFFENLAHYFSNETQTISQLKTVLNTILAKCLLHRYQPYDNLKRQATEPSSQLVGF